MPDTSFSKSAKSAADAAKTAGEKAKTASAQIVNSIEDQIATATDQAEKFIDSFDMPEGVRALAERSLSQSREAYERLRDQAQETVKLMETSAAKASDSATTLNLKAVDFAAANLEASFGLMRELMTTRDAAKAVELQMEFASRQASALSAQSKEFGELAAKVTQDAVAPLRDHMEKSFAQFRSTFAA